MRLTLKPEPAPYSFRQKKGFLIKPKCLWLPDRKNKEWRWLETAEWTQQYISDQADNYFWMDYEWIEYQKE